MSDLHQGVPVGPYEQHGVVDEEEDGGGEPRRRAPGQCKQQGQCKQEEPLSPVALRSPRAGGNTDSVTARLAVGTQALHVAAVSHDR